jgi:diketogulonate reductase-like aldo/keto reductase
MRAIVLPSGDRFPVLGQGTWHLAEVPARRNTEIAALRRGLDIGMTLIDTAEMYADGAAEILFGEAIAGRRDSVFLVTKVLPHHATLPGTVRACRDSLRRLNTDRIDLYLLHWRGNAPLAQTVDAFIELCRAGLIRNRAPLDVQLDRLTSTSSIARFHLRCMPGRWKCSNAVESRCCNQRAVRP